MISNSDWQAIASQIEQATNQPFTITEVFPVSGGCINDSYLIQSNHHHYFIKLNQHELIAMFEAEYKGLNEISNTNTIKVPRPIHTGVTHQHAFLVLEPITFTSTNQQSDTQLGQQLAALHKLKQVFFGWHLDNTIGSTEQINVPHSDWVTFWRDKRLGFQLSLATRNGVGKQLIQSGEKLSDSLDYFFENYTPQPSLLHGDLWSGNVGVTKQGKPIIYDPACYYGDRETDIAMTELFGGFSASFYTAYNESFPLHSGYSIRKTLYNLYHILNHLNLFGTSYQQQAQHMIDSLLSEIV